MRNECFARQNSEARWKTKVAKNSSKMYLQTQLNVIKNLSSTPHTPQGSLYQILNYLAILTSYSLVPFYLSLINLKIN
jgi:hypothetical protein